MEEGGGLCPNTIFISQQNFRDEAESIFFPRQTVTNQKKKKILFDLHNVLGEFSE